MTGITKSSDGDLAGIDNMLIFHALIVKISALGELEWLKVYNSNANVKSVKLDAEGYIYSITPSGGFSNGRATVAKLDPEGNVIWEDEIFVGSLTFNVDVAVDDQGNVYRLTSPNSFGANDDIVITKFDADGNELWRNTYEGDDTDESGLLEVRGDKLIVAGRTNSTSGDFISENGGFDGFITTLTLNGEVISTVYIGGSGDDEIEDMKIVGNKIFVAGESTSTDNGFEVPYPESKDVFVAELDFDGNIVWIDYSGGSENDEFPNLDIVNNDGLVLGYKSLSQDGSLDGADEGASIYLSYYELHSTVNTKNISKVDFIIYPNPTIEKITINTEDYENYGLKIYSIDGLLLKTMNKLERNEIDISSLPSGLLKVCLYKDGLIVKTKSIFKG